MKNFLRDLVSDNNDINEKSFIGIVSFFIMVLISIADAAASYWGKTIAVDDNVYDSLFWIVIGCFGISEGGKVINKLMGKREPIE